MFLFRVESQVRTGRQFVRLRPGCVWRDLSRTDTDYVISSHRAVISQRDYDQQFSEKSDYRQTYDVSFFMHHHWLCYVRDQFSSFYLLLYKNETRSIYIWPLTNDLVVLTSQSILQKKGSSSSFSLVHSLVTIFNLISNIFNYIFQR